MAVPPDRKNMFVGVVNQDDLARQIYLAGLISRSVGQPPVDPLRAGAPEHRPGSGAVARATGAMFGKKSDTYFPARTPLGRDLPDTRFQHIETRSIGPVTRTSPAPTTTISTYRPSWRESLSDAVGEVAERQGANRYGRQYVEDRVGDLADFVPGIGQLLQGNDIRRSFDRGDYGDAGVRAIMALPVAGIVESALGKAAKFLRGTKKGLASRSVNLYDPPAKAQRDFALDYPKGGVADATGRLQVDMEGRPLTGKYVAGRTHVGASESGIPAEAYDAIAEAATGKVPVATKSRQQIGQDAGRYVVMRDRRLGRVISRDIYTHKDLTLDETQKTVAHEIGHMFDEMAGPISMDNLGREPAQIYNTLNTGWEQTRNLTGPRDLGYKEKEFRDEYIAEAIRAYMADPNYMKTVAPRTAKRIRLYVNSDPRLKNIIQFNSLAGPALLGAGTLGYGAIPKTEKPDK